MSSTVTFKGDFSNAPGGAISLLLTQGSNPLFNHHHFIPFSTSSPLEPGSYKLSVNGSTQGVFQIDIQGSTTIDQTVPKSYPQGQNIVDVFNFTV